jgi:hypothetical protein
MGPRVIPIPSGAARCCRSRLLRLGPGSPWRRRIHSYAGPWAGQIRLVNGRARCAKGAVRIGHFRINAKGAGSSITRQTGWPMPWFPSRYELGIRRDRADLKLAKKSAIGRRRRCQRCAEPLERCRNDRLQQAVHATEVGVAGHRRRTDLGRDLARLKRLGTVAFQQARPGLDQTFTRTRTHARHRAITMLC